MWLLLYYINLILLLTTVIVLAIDKFGLLISKKYEIHKFKFISNYNLLNIKATPPTSQVYPLFNKQILLTILNNKAIASSNATNQDNEMGGF